MGTIQKEHLIVELWGESDSSENTKEIDKFISKLPEEFRNLFFKCVTETNSYITYFMAWDGSKEGWDTSETANEIRDKFVEVVKKSYESASILHIIPEGEIYDEDRIERL